MADRFVEALRSLERDGDAGPLGDLYADDSRAGSVQHPDAYLGRDGARQFWAAYRSTFATVESTFRTVIGGDRAAALEWTTAGTVSGNLVRYDGVTVLEFGDGRIVRSCAYYDATQLGRTTLRAAGVFPGSDAVPGMVPVEPVGQGDETSVPVRTEGPGGVDARPVVEENGWRSDPGETG
jgi:ketosteroid isomerase-like protein